AVRQGRRRVEDLRHAASDGLGENALALQNGRDRRDHGPAGSLPLPLIVGEEERAAALNRSAGDAAELVPSEFRLGRDGRGEEVASVERLVAEELEAGSVELVRARALGEVDDAAVEAPELGGRAV